MPIEDQLRLLNKAELTVFFYKCRGLKYALIAKKMHYGIDSVQGHASRAYAKLGIRKDMHWTERVRILEKEVCPRLPKSIEELDAIEWTPELIAETAPEPELDSEMMALVLYDEMRLAETEQPAAPEVIVIPAQPRRRQRWGGLIRGCVVLVLLVVVACLAFRLGRGTPTETPITQPTDTREAAPVQASNTPKSAPPTETNPRPSNTPAPRPTLALVPPADGILFQDNFENGLNPEWQAFGNDWLVANGELTLSTNAAFNNRYSWIGLNHPEWKNYTLSLDVMLSTGQRSPFGNIAIVVRDGTQSPDIGVGIDTLALIYWATVGGSASDTLPISGFNTDTYFGSDSNVEISVQGNNYTLRVNGQNIQTISMSGYDSGGVNLGIECTYSLQCPSFDNVKVMYLP